MHKSVDRIVSALKNAEQITVYGDYDVDGQTGVSLLVKVFRDLAVDPKKVLYFIPNRADDGYGLHKEALTKIAQTSSLVVTVDCGVSAVTEVDYANKIGLDIIITDHHEAGEQLPRALGVINPKRSDSNYPFPNLAGVGVAFKLVQALGEVFERDFTSYLDLVALGTVADLVPLIDENRVITKFGLKQLENTVFPGFAELIKLGNMKSPYKASDFGFKIGPRLNAGGRMGESARGVDLLLSDDFAQIEQLAQELDQENKQRQDTEAEILDQALEMIISNGWEDAPAIVIASEHWHSGVIGIVASRIVERYHRPTLIIAIEDGIGVASARSISGFNLFAALEQCTKLLIKFGGHEMAAGFSVAAENIEQLRSQICALAKEWLTADDYIPKLTIDAQLPLKKVDADLMHNLELLAPYGFGNLTPVFQLAGAVHSVRSFGASANHARCRIQDHTGLQIEGIGWNMHTRFQELESHYEQLDFAVYPQHGYRDPNVIELVIRDVQASDVPANYIQTWMTKYPWSLTPEYERLSALNLDYTAQSVSPSGEYHISDYRSAFDKLKVIKEQGLPREQTLIYAATPKRALEICRELRLMVPGGYEFIGFEHEFLTVAQRLELDKLIDDKQIRWVVSTCSRQMDLAWVKIFLCDVPFCQKLLDWLGNLLVPQGTLALTYGRTEWNYIQQLIKQTFLDRDGLAKLYVALTQAGQEMFTPQELDNIATKAGVLTGLEFGLGVFAELELIKYQNRNILIMPRPNSKLDLHSSVLYNEGMIKREEYLTYSRHCLERGFSYELKRQNTCD